MKTIPCVKDLQTILILRGEGSLGDAVLSSCAYREIKKANPSVRITVAAYGASLGYLRQITAIDEVFELPVRRVIRPHQRWPSLIKAGLALHKKHFDLVIDSSAKNFYNWRLFKWLCGGKDRVLDFAHSPVPFGAPLAHASRHEQAILEQLGITRPDPSYDLPVPSSAQEKLDAFTQTNAPQGYILLNPFGSVAERTLNAQTCTAAVKALPEFPVFIACMPSQRSAAETVCRALQTQGVAGHVYQTADVFDLFALVRAARLVVTPDTAVVHIASGYHQPTLAFYNAFWIYNAPNNSQAFVVKTDRADVNRFEQEALLHAAASVKECL